MKPFALLLLLVLALAATVPTGTHGDDSATQGAHLRQLQGDDQQPEQPEQPEQPQQPEQPVMQPGTSMGVSNVGGGGMTAENADAMGGSKEAGGNCNPSAVIWPYCRRCDLALLSSLVLPWVLILAALPLWLLLNGLASVTRRSCS
ncbi:hypothetical protein PC121_g10708 [Phytophthora cactorum]|nr:hypothetical protein PC120_g24583 [Phytophthora cactorum]KAG3066875.1 hypothetical protein PC121_g10708 [Phytophthora cactorum]KAG4040447.1 hypothetical protein PC123_g24014 [Phytophthora cactorum]